jgi:serpin B
MIYRTFLLIIFQIFLLQNASASLQDTLFKEIIDKNKGENVIFSPLSLYQVLSLVLNGAGGETREEVFKVLFPDKDLDEQLIKDVNSNIEKIIKDIESENNGQVDNKVIFNNVNALFHKEGISFKDDFKQICTQYNTSYFKLESLEQVNNYVSEHTNGKITDFLQSINNALFMIINALYFKGTWDKKFDESLTTKRAFKNSNGTVMVDTMYQEYEDGLYYEDEKVQMFSLSYSYNNLPYKMTIILPNEKKYSSPMDYLNEEKINFHEVSSKLEYKNHIHLYLPKFKYALKIDLIPILEKLGMKLAFMDNSADFSNLVNGACFISQFFQKTFIDLNENGTEAAAATVAVFENSTGPMILDDIQRYMHVNHSFIYMIESNEIKDSNNNNIMPFVGIVNYIEETKDTSGTNPPGNESPKNSISDEPTDNDTDDPKKFLPRNLGQNIKVSLGIICLILLNYL